MKELQLTNVDIEILLDYLPGLYKEDTPEAVKQLRRKIIRLAVENE